MKLAGFIATQYTVAIEHEGKTYEVATPWDGFSYDALSRAMVEQHAIVLPAMPHDKFFDMVSDFVRASIANGEDTVGPIAIVNRIVTGRVQPRKH